MSVRKWQSTDVQPNLSVSETKLSITETHQTGSPTQDHRVLEFHYSNTQAVLEDPRAGGSGKLVLAPNNRLESCKAMFWVQGRQH